MVAATSAELLALDSPHWIRAVTSFVGDNGVHPLMSVQASIGWSPGSTVPKSGSGCRGDHDLTQVGWCLSGHRFLVAPRRQGFPVRTDVRHNGHMVGW